MGYYTGASRASLRASELRPGGEEHRGPDRVAAEWGAGEGQSVASRMSAGPRLGSGIWVLL